MGEDSWKYFVSPEENLLSERPLIFEGSRGTGKTMFLLCNSWREKFSEYNFDCDKISTLFSKNSFVGIYYKVDGRFVGNNLNGKGVDPLKWISIFNTYFNIVVVKEVYEFINKCIELKIIENSLLQKLNNRIGKKLSIEGNQISIDEIVERFEEILDNVEDFSNDPETPLPKLLNAGTLIKTSVEYLKKIEIFRDVRFHVLIDEYEELNEPQQIQINTLLKQSDYWLVYDICVKTNGIYTFNTISGNEIIQEPHDFKLHKPELNDYDNSKEYLTFLKNICQKRLVECIGSETDSVIWSNIENYLQRYPDEVINSIYLDSPKYKNEVTDVLSNLLKNDESIKGIEEKEINQTLYNDSPLVERMHIALLHRKDISGKILYEAIKNNDKIYTDWKHNTLYATQFLLCNELNVDFQYHGLKVFAQLSSGVIRYFIEICKSAFDNAISNGFSFENPRAFTLNEQTQAAQFVSESKVAKIDGFVPSGKILKRLVLNLGKIYFLLQTKRGTTLGEPEVNHFTTSLFELRTFHSEATKYLEFAEMHNILQPSLPTKTKSNDVVEVVDYHINHIYCPFFKISHRRKRKITIAPSVLSKLITGNTDEINKVIKKYDEIDENQISQGKLF